MKPYTRDNQPVCCKARFTTRRGANSQCYTQLWAHSCCLPAREHGSLSVHCAL